MDENKYEFLHSTAPSKNENRRRLSNAIFREEVTMFLFVFKVF
jgi:hypothetical protein